MSSAKSATIECLESRRLCSAQAFVSGHTLNIFGDPQLPNLININGTNAPGGTISVSIYVVSDPVAGPVYDSNTINHNFPVKGIKLIYIRGGNAADKIEDTDSLRDIDPTLGFDINTKIDTLDGDNLVFIGNQNAVVNGGNGSDTVVCGDGNDTLHGNGGNDVLSGGKGKNKIAGGDGDDILESGTGKTIITGGNGNDTIRTQDLAKGGDQIFAGAGDDIVICGDGNDSLWGGAGNDRLTAGNGHVTFGNGLGNDYCFNTMGSAVFYTRTDKTNIPDYNARFDKVIHAISKFETIDPVFNDPTRLRDADVRRLRNADQASVFDSPDADGYPYPR